MKKPANLVFLAVVLTFCGSAALWLVRQYQGSRSVEPLPELTLTPLVDTFGTSTNVDAPDTSTNLPSSSSTNGN
jgi:hypothetical protein